MRSGKNFLQNYVSWKNLNFDLLYTVMDDKEYYSMMNRSNSAIIIQQLQKDLQKKKVQNSKPSQSFKDLTVRQGKADAEMLYEKNDISGV